MMLGLVVGPLLSHAAWFLPLSVEALTESADLVVRGKVVSKQVERDAEGRILTRVLMDVLEVWKGSVQGDTTELVHPGGILGERKVEVPFMAEYRLGDEVVVFLRLNDRGEGVTIGLAQGRFDVTTEPSTQQRYVQNLFHGGAPPSGPLAPRYRMPHQLPMLLGDLHSRVLGKVSHSTEAGE